MHRSAQGSDARARLRCMARRSRAGPGAATRAAAHIWWRTTARSSPRTARTCCAARRRSTPRSAAPRCLSRSRTAAQTAPAPRRGSCGTSPPRTKTARAPRPPRRTPAPRAPTRSARPPRPGSEAGRSGLAVLRRARTSSRSRGDATERSVAGTAPAGASWESVAACGAAQRKSPSEARFTRGQARFTRGRQRESPDGARSTRGRPAARAGSGGLQCTG